MTQQPWPQRFFVEFSPEPEPASPVQFTDDPAIILFFISWAYSAEMGGTHELALAASHLRRQLKVDLKPVYQYADRNVDTPQDRMELERSWQPAADLARAATEIAEHWEHPDDTLAPLIEGYQHLAPRLRELAAMCEWAVQHAGPEAPAVRVRMSFDLENTEHHAQRPEG
ncbi:MAG: hypothetical protein M0R73_07980 [Dehalococcoidia bacterium]|nr:hypothetical protein [Dehalococcoidia bacterium]